MCKDKPSQHILKGTCIWLHLSPVKFWFSHGTGQQPSPDPDSSVKPTALICSSTFKRVVHMSVHLLRVVPILTCGLRESCGLGKKSSSFQPSLSSLIPARRQVASATNTPMHSLAPKDVLNHLVSWIRLGLRPHSFSCLVLQIVSSGFNTSIMILMTDRDGLCVVPCERTRPHRWDCGHENEFQKGSHVSSDKWE